MNKNIKEYCPHCKIIVEVLPGYYYWKCRKCYNPVRLSLMNKIKIKIN